MSAWFSTTLHAAVPGSPHQFATTHWSVVLAAKMSGSREVTEALEKLCRIYWYPLYAYARRRGLESADAKDLTQEFFARFVEKNYLASVDPVKGKFRSFLLASFKHFLANQRDHQQAIKRGGGKTFVALDADVEDRYSMELDPDRPPDNLYDQRWATTVMEQALRRLREEFLAAGKSEDKFEQLRRFLATEPGEGEYAQVAAQLNITPGAVGVAVHRLRQRYSELIYAEVANTVAHPTEVEEELRYLFSLLTSS